MHIHYYFDDKTLKSESRVYNDDGTSSLVGDKCQELIFKSELIKNELIISMIDFELHDNYQNKINLIIHNVSSLPRKITNNGEKVLDYIYNKETKTLSLNFAQRQVTQLGNIKLKF